METGVPAVVARAAADDRPVAVERAALCVETFSVVVGVVGGVLRAWDGDWRLALVFLAGVVPFVALADALRRGSRIARDALVAALIGYVMWVAHDVRAGGGLIIGAVWVGGLCAILGPEIAGLYRRPCREWFRSKAGVRAPE